MDEPKLYRIYCKTCHIHYVSEYPAVVGHPCPNPSCPRGNAIVTEVQWQQALLKALIAAGGIAYTVVILTNLGGWGAFLVDLTISFLTQTIIALILFGLFLGIFLNSLKQLLKPALSNKQILSGTFFIAVVVALLVLPFMFKRSIDIYDVAQTIILGIAANLLTKPFERLLS